MVLLWSRDTLGQLLKDRVWGIVKSLTHKPLFLFRKVESVISKRERLVVLNMDNEGLVSQPDTQPSVK